MNTGDTLFFPSCSLADSGWYFCTVENEWGKDTSQRIHLTIIPNDPPEFPEGHRKKYTLKEEENLTIPIRVNDKEHDTIVLKFLNYDSLCTEFYFTQKSLSLSFTDDSGNIYFSPGLNPGRFVFKFEISDLYRSTFDSIVVVVQDSNFIPQCTFDSTIIIYESDSCSLNLSEFCTDKDQDSLYYVLRNGLPNNDMIDSITGLYRFTPTYWDSGHYTITIDISDGKSSDTVQFNCVVKNSNRSPFFTRGAPSNSYTIPEDSVLTIPIKVSDPDSDICSITIDSEKTTLPGKDSIRIINSNLLWKSNYEDEGSYVLFLKVSDGIDNDSVAVTIDVGDVNRRCNIELKTGNGRTFPGSGFDTLTEMTRMVCTLHVTDPDAEDTPIILEPLNLPPKADFNQTTGIFSFQPDFSTSTIINGSKQYKKIIFQATDSPSNQQSIVTCTLNILVIDSNTIPHFSNLNLSIEEESTIAVDLKVSDADGDTLSWSLINSLSYGSLDLQEGHITGSSEFNYTSKNHIEQREETLLLHVRDAIHNCTTTVSIKIHAKNDPPVFDSISQMRVKEDNTDGVTFNIYAHDPDGDNISWNLQTGPRKGVIDTGGIISSDYPEGTFTPIRDSCASDTFYFTITDNVHESEPIPAKIHIDSVNDKPIFTGTPPANTIQEDGVFIITTNRYRSVIFDIDNKWEDLNILPGSGDNYSIVNGNEVKPDPNFSNNYIHIPVMISDGKDTSESVIQNIWIEPVNDAPVITGQNVQKPLEGFDNKDLTITLDNIICTDIDNSPSELSLILLKGYNYTVVSDGVIRPDSGFTGELDEKELMVRARVDDGNDTSELFENLKVIVKRYVNNPPWIKINIPKNRLIDYTYPIPLVAEFGDSEGIAHITVDISCDDMTYPFDTINPEKNNEAHTYTWYLPFNTDIFTKEYKISASIVDNDKKETTHTNYFRIDNSSTSDSMTIRAILDENELHDTPVVYIKNKIVLRKDRDRRITELHLKNLNLEKIAHHIGLLNKVEKLNLSNNTIKELPSAIGDLNELEDLSLSKNVLDTLPHEIRNLDKLKDLDLSDNRLRSLPSSLSLLNNLKKIKCNNNKFTAFPQVICKLKNLNEINLNGNQIDKIPDEIGSLINLKILYLNNNSISTISSNIGQLVSLQQLFLNNNRLQSLPQKINGELQKLRQLDLSDNQIDSLPSYIGTFSELSSLLLDNNNINDLPGSIVNLRKIKKLDLSQNYLTKENSTPWGSWADTLDTDWSLTQKGKSMN